MGKRVYVVARSRISEVDVGAVPGIRRRRARQCRVGYGKGTDLIQVVAALKRFCAGRYLPSVPPRISCRRGKDRAFHGGHFEARELLTRYNVNACRYGRETMIGIHLEAHRGKGSYHELGMCRSRVHAQ